MSYCTDTALSELAIAMEQMAVASMRLEAELGELERRSEERHSAQIALLGQISNVLSMPDSDARIATIGQIARSVEEALAAVPR